MRGARLLDVVIPGHAEGPCGVALDAADPDQSMFFPPVTGVVPEEAAVDRAAGDARPGPQPRGHDQEGPVKAP